MYHHHGDLVGSLAYLSELHAKSFFLDLRERTADIVLTEPIGRPGLIFWMRQGAQILAIVGEGLARGSNKNGSILLQNIKLKHSNRA